MRVCAAERAQAGGGSGIRNKQQVGLDAHGDGFAQDIRMCEGQLKSQHPRETAGSALIGGTQRFSRADGRLIPQIDQKAHEIRPVDFFHSLLGQHGIRMLRIPEQTAGQGLQFRGTACGSERILIPDQELQKARQVSPGTLFQAFAHGQLHHQTGDRNLHDFTPPLHTCLLYRKTAAR